MTTMGFTFDIFHYSKEYGFVVIKDVISLFFSSVHNFVMWVWNVAGNFIIILLPEWISYLLY